MGFYSFSDYSSFPNHRGPNYIDQLFYNKIQELNPKLNQSFVSLILAKVINVSNGKIATDDEKILSLASDYKAALDQLHFYRGLVVILCAALWVCL